MIQKTTIILLSGLSLCAYGAKIITDSDGSVEVILNEDENVTIKRCKSASECVTLYPNDVQEGNDSSSPVEFEMIRFEPGTFMMGSPKSDRKRGNDEEGADGKPVEVTITSAFAIGKYEVTQRQWFAVMDENPSLSSKEVYCKDDYIKVTLKSGKKVGMCPNHPVEKVSWSDTQAFFRRLNEKEGIKGCLKNPRAVGCWRLPTEAEWEYAARSGTTSRYSFGDDEGDLRDYAWYVVNSNDEAHAVGIKEANPKGLHDMHGNVWEWTMDKYANKLKGGDDPLQLNGKKFVIRGGSWLDTARALRSAYRMDNPNFRTVDTGFRPVRTL